MILIIVIISALIASAMILLAARTIKKEITKIRTDLKEVDNIIKGE